MIRTADKSLIVLVPPKHQEPNQPIYFDVYLYLFDLPLQDFLSVSKQAQSVILSLSVKDLYQEEYIDNRLRKECFLDIVGRGRSLFLFDKTKFDPNTFLSQNEWGLYDHVCCLWINYDHDTQSFIVNHYYQNNTEANK